MGAEAVVDHTRWMVDAGMLRASDADRDDVLEQLRRAHVEGRLDHDELSERAGSALRSRTVGELAALTADLPPVVRPLGPGSAAPVGRVPGPSSAIAPAGARRGWTPTQLGMAVVAAVCLTVGVLAVTDGRVGIWPGWLVFLIVLRLRRGRRPGSRGPRDRP